MKVLVAEDELCVLETLRYILEDAGAQVVTARDGEEALRRVMGERPDVAVLDLMMPRMDGYQVCRTIRQDPLLTGTRVVILTARGHKYEEAQALAAGADAFLRKPIDDDDLLARLAQLVEP